MTPEQMVKAQQRLAGHGKLAVGVTGSLAKGVVTENRLIEQDGDIGRKIPLALVRLAFGGDGRHSVLRIARRPTEPDQAGSDPRSIKTTASTCAPRRSSWPRRRCAPARRWRC